MAAGDFPVLFFSSAWSSSSAGSLFRPPEELLRVRVPPSVLLCQRSVRATPQRAEGGCKRVEHRRTKRMVVYLLPLVWSILTISKAAGSLWILMKVIDSCYKQKLGRPQQTLVAQQCESHIQGNLGQSCQAESGTSPKTKLRLCSIKLLNPGQFCLLLFLKIHTAFPCLDATAGCSFSKCSEVYRDVPEWATEEEAEGSWLRRDSPPWPNSPRSPEASSWRGRHRSCS